MRKFFRNIHLWLSLPAGVVVTVMCLTGAILVFQEEILYIAHPERYRVKESSPAPLPLDALAERVNAALDNDTLTAIQIPDEAGRTYTGTLSSGPRSHVYINPYTGEIAGYYNYREGFFHQVMRLHRWLMFKDTATGRAVTGVSTLFLVIILISGAVVWRPRKGVAKRPFFTVKWKGSARRRLFDLHRVTGIYAVAFLLLLSLTGLMWSFDWYRNGVAALFSIENRTGNQTGKQTGTRTGDQAGSPKYPKAREEWRQQALEVTRNEIPDFQYIRIMDNGTISVLPGKAPHRRATDTYRFDGRQKTIGLIQKYGEKRDRSYLMGWAYALHTGSWGGIWSKSLVFLASLAGASLPVTGYILWGRKRKRQAL